MHGGCRLARALLGARYGGYFEVQELLETEPLKRCGAALCQSENRQTEQYAHERCGASPNTGLTHQPSRVHRGIVLSVRCAKACGFLRWVASLINPR
jgi:hypothetical protein